MQLSSWLRLALVGSAVIVSAASATSNQQQPPPTGYYPQPAQQQAAGEGPQASQPVARYEQPAPPPAVVDESPPPPRDEPPAYQDPPPPREEPKPEVKSTSSHPEKRTQWVCNATGWWQKCETSSYQCYAQTSTMLGFGSTEALARVSSESLCNTAMSRMMSVNFTYRTSVTSRCKAISCSPPNAK